MASVAAIARALRERYGNEETVLTLSDLLSFLHLFQNTNNDDNRNSNLAKG